MKKTDFEKDKPTVSELRWKKEEYTAQLDQKLQPTEELRTLDLEELTSEITTQEGSMIRNV